MDIITALILGLLQGITEFLPISSSGHLMMVRDFLNIDDVNGFAVDAVLHLATTLAVITYFRAELWVLVQTLIRKLGRLPTNEKDATLLYALLVGTIPGVILGMLLEEFMSTFERALLVAGVLFLSALFFMYAEWRYHIKPPNGSITVRRGFLIGIFQALALIPGFSRSGATLAGGMLVGLSRYEAARFSFLLAIPITLGVGTKKLIDLIIIGETVNWGPVAVAAVVSYVVAIIVIHFFLDFIRKYTLWPFIWYSIILAIFVAYVSWFL